MELNQTTDTQGALSSLLGDLDGLKDHPSEDTGARKPSKAPVGASEERGRSSRDKQQKMKKVLKTLEPRDQGPNKVAERLGTETRSRKKRKPEDSQSGKGFMDLKQWFERQGSAQEKGQERLDLKTDQEVEKL